jgi:hypothetical protein
LFDLIVIPTPAEIIYVAQVSLQFYLTLRRLSGFEWLELLEDRSGDWKAVQEQHARLLPSVSSHEEESEPEFVGPPLIELVPTAGPTNGLIFGTRVEREPVRGKPLIVEADSQLSLF